MGLTLAEIQAAVGRWSSVNFPANTPLEPLEGLIEEWIAVDGFDGVYDVSSLGRVKRVKSKPGAKAGRILKPHAIEGGYLAVDLYLPDGSGRRHFLVHRLVASAFIGKRPDGMDVNHKDGNKKNNTVANLEYLTRSENMLHASENGLVDYATGEENPKAKLTWDQVREIRSMYRPNKFGAKRIAKIYGVRSRTIRSILLNLTWKEE